MTETAPTPAPAPRAPTAVDSLDAAADSLSAKAKVWLVGALLAGSSLGGGASSLLGNQEVVGQVRELRISLESLKEGQDEQKADLKDLRKQLQEAGGNRWTRSDHDAYARERQRVFDRLDARMDRLERSLDKHK